MFWHQIPADVRQEHERAPPALWPVCITCAITATEDLVCADPHVKTGHQGHGTEQTFEAHIAALLHALFQSSLQ